MRGLVLHDHHLCIAWQTTAQVLSLLQNQFDSLDLSDNVIVRLEGFPKLPRLKTLLLSNNRVMRIARNLEGKLLAAPECCYDDLGLNGSDVSFRCHSKSGLVDAQRQQAFQPCGMQQRLLATVHCVQGILLWNGAVIAAYVQACKSEAMLGIRHTLRHGLGT